MPRVLIVDDEENMRHLLGVILKREGYDTSAVATGAAALDECQKGGVDFVLSDVRMPKMGGLDLLDAVQALSAPPVVIMMSAYGTVDSAIEAMKRGAYDYISKPFKPDEVVLVLRKAEERERLKRENQKLRGQLKRAEPHGVPGLVAKSARMHEVLRTVAKIAEYKTTVLITGESGTGKELIARALHSQSPRKEGPFVAVNCGAIPETLLESELFGHKKGAFTDASRDKKGLFEEADGGTLFLDEVGELPLGLQVKLLRVLQGEEIRRLGDTRDIKLDVRVLAATVRDLASEVEEGGFREDLFYRLNVLPLHLPPLRERTEDIPPLVSHFLAKNNEKLGMAIAGIEPEAMRLLMAYSWPGNVRELENTIEHAMVLAEGDRVGKESLPEKVREGSTNRMRVTLPAGELSIKKTTRAIEEELIRKALEKTGGNRTSAARILEISHRALLYKIKEYGIDA